MEAILSKLKLSELKNVIRYYNRQAKIKLTLRKPELIAALVKHLEKPIELDIEVAKQPAEKVKRSKPLKRQISANTEANLTKLSAQNKLLADVIAERRKTSETKAEEARKLRETNKQFRQVEDERLKARLKELEKLM
jgi:hypothetical protein